MSEFESPPCAPADIIADIVKAANLSQEAGLRRVDGVRHMSRDEFEPAIRLLLTGIERNTENEPMNADMRLLIAKMEEATAEKKRLEAGNSAAHFLLQQYSAKPTQH